MKGQLVSSERTQRILGSVVIRDTKAMIQTAKRAKRDVTALEKEGCLERARRYGVSDEVAALLAD